MDYSIVYRKVASSEVNVIQVNADNTCRDFTTKVFICDSSKVLTCSPTKPVLIFSKILAFS